MQKQLCIHRVVIVVVVVVEMCIVFYFVSVVCAKSRYSNVKEIGSADAVRNN